MNYTRLFLPILYISIAFFLFILLYFIAKQHFFMTKHKQAKIALMFFAESPIVKNMRQGIIDELDQSGLSYTITNYNGNQDRNLAKPNVEDAIDQKHDLLCTLGVHYSVNAKEITDKKHYNIPIVFAGVGNPESRNLVESRERSGNNVTGVALDEKKYYDMSTRVEVLFEVRPDLKNILIPFTEDAQFFHDEAANLEKTIDHYAKKKNMDVTVTKLPVKGVGEITERLKSLSDDLDVVILFRDTGIIASIPGIVKLCNLHGTTLYTSELDSVQHGAAIGFGQNEYVTGRECGKKIVEILVNKKKPTDVPVISFYEPEVHINKETKDLQGLSSFDKSKAQHPLLKNAQLVS